jgi:hypothetical protein
MEFFHLTTGEQLRTGSVCSENDDVHNYDIPTQVHLKIYPARAAAFFRSMQHVGVRTVCNLGVHKLYLNSKQAGTSKQGKWSIARIGLTYAGSRAFYFPQV